MTQIATRSRPAQLLGPHGRGVAVAVGAAAATLLVTGVVLPSGAGGRGVPASILFEGVIQGLILALPAVGLLLIFRVSGIVNFAQIAMGTAGALLTFEVIRFLRPVPFVLALLIGLVVGAGIGALFELVFNRRFFRAPRLLLTVATIIGGPLLSGYALRIVQQLPGLPSPAQLRSIDISSREALAPYLPFPGFSFQVGSSPSTYGFPELVAIEVSLLLLLGVGLLLRYSKIGVAAQAVTQNMERAALLGVGVAKISTYVWALAGVLSAAAVILQGFTGQASVGGVFEPLSVLPAIAVAVVARFRSIPVALVAALLLGVLQRAIDFSLPLRADAAGALLLLVVVVVALLLQRRQLMRLALADSGSYRATEELRPVPVELASLPGIRVIRYTALSLLLIVLAVYPLVVSTGQVSIAQNVFITGIVVLSLVVLTGWAGQVSLGQYAFVSIGAVLAGGLTVSVGLTFWLSVPIATVLTAGFAVLVGIPALRVPGLFLAVATFALAAVVAAALFSTTWFTGFIPTSIPRPELFLLDFDGERQMYYLCLASLIGVLVFVLNLRRSRIGRAIIAVRNNEASAQAFSLSPVATKLLAFAISGGLAGFAGALLAFQLRGVASASGFGTKESFDIFIFAILGGISSVAGGLLGALFLAISLRFFQGSPIFLYVISFLPALLLYFFPGGLISIFAQVRDAGLRLVAQRKHIVVPSLFADYDPDAVARQLIPLSKASTSSGLASIPADNRYERPSRMHGTNTDLPPAVSPEPRRPVMNVKEVRA